MSRLLPFVLITAATALLAGCAPDFSPNTYSSNAVQLANKVESGVVVGFREIAISANGNIGAVTGGAAGGILGAQYADSALAAVGASAVGAIVGDTIDHAARDTTGWEYIVRKVNGDLLSVTQRERKPLALGQRVLVIMGPQARVIPDYAVIPDSPPPPAPAKTEAKAEPAPVKVEVVLTLPPGVSAQQLQPTATVVAAQVPKPETNAPAAPAATVVRAPKHAPEADGQTAHADMTPVADAAVSETAPAPEPDAPTIRAALTPVVDAPVDQP